VQKKELEKAIDERANKSPAAELTAAGLLLQRAISS
jgi:hypothetical protein